MEKMIIPRLKRKLGILLLSNCLFTGLAMADSERVWPILTFTCDQEKKEVKLKNEVKWGAAGENFNFDVQQGTYNPWDLVGFKDEGKQRITSEKKQLTLSCVLGGSEYTFQIKPKLFNDNFYGKCGDRISVTVSVFKGAALLLDEQPLEAFCHGNSPVLRGLKIQAGKNKVKLYRVSRSQFY
jgi:hypothetical protein